MYDGRTTQRVLSYEFFKIFTEYTSRGMMIHKSINNIETNLSRP